MTMNMNRHRQGSRTYCHVCRQNNVAIMTDFSVKCRNRRLRCYPIASSRMVYASVVAIIINVLLASSITSSFHFSFVPVYAYSASIASSISQNGSRLLQPFRNRRSSLPGRQACPMIGYHSSRYDFRHRGVHNCFQRPQFLRVGSGVIATRDTSLLSTVYGTILDGPRNDTLIATHGTSTQMTQTASAAD